MMDANELERAKAYAESIVWRLETLQSRSRYNIDTGKLKRLPTRLRRFSNGIPQDNVASTLEALEAMAPYRGIIYNGEDDLDHEYRPTTTLIRKDDSMKSGGDATYTIIQDLILMGERDLYLMGDSSSCSQVSETEWHWDEGEIIECPQGGQGVSYRIENVSRSAENDLFSYAVRKVQAVTQHMPAMTVECSEDSVVTLETWDNVYGEPGAFKWDDVVHDGGALGVPNPCTGKKGLLVKVQVQENPDCTFRVSVERTTSKVDDAAEYMRYRDQYKAQAMDLVTHAAKPLPKTGVEYADGVMTKYEVKQNEDGTYDNRTTVETEREVVESTVLKRVTPFHTIVERTDTNVKSPLTGLPAGVKYGTYESTKTPGGLYTVKLTTLEYRFDSSALSCKKTIFQHDHSIDTSVAEMPADAHVVEAGGGVIHDIRFRTDEQGGVVKTESTTTELRVPTSTEMRSVMPYRTRVERTDTNMPAPASALPTGFRYGSYKYTKTPGGLYVNEYIGIENVQMDLGHGCKKTAFQHDHSVEETVQSLPAQSHVVDAGGGKVSETRFHVDGEGTIIKSTTETQEIQEGDSAGGRTLTARYEIVKRTDTNMASRASGLLSGFQYGSFQYQMTPGKWYVNEYVGYRARKLDVMRAHTADIFRHEDTTENTADGLPAAKHTMASGGTITTEEARLDENGIATVTTKTVKELAVPSSVIETVKTPRFTITTRTDTNVSTAAKNVEGGTYGSFKATKTPGGLYVNEFRSYTPAYLKFAASCSKTVFQHEHSTEASVSGGVAEGDVQNAGGGKTYVRQDHMGDEGVVVRTERYTEEIPYPTSSREVVKTPRAIVTRETDTNMTAPAPNLKRGKYGSYKYTVTPGGLYVNEYMSVEMNPGERSQKSRTRDRFREEHIDVESKEDLDAVPNHVEEAANGVIVKMDGHVDDQGVVTVATTKVTERHAPASSMETTVTPRATIIRQTDTNERMQAKALKRGTYGTFKYAMTPGGLYVNEYLSVEPTPGGKSQKSRTRDKFREEHIDVESKKDLDAVPNHVEEAANGVIVKMDGHVDDQGVVTVATTTVTERAVTQSSEETVKTPRATIKRRTDTNVTQRAGSLLSGEYGSYKYTMTPGGRFVNEYLSIEKNEEGASMKMRTADMFKREESDTKSSSGLGEVENVTTVSNGTITVSEGHVDDQGIATLTTRKVIEQPVLESSREEMLTPRAKIIRIVDTNNNAKAAALKGGGQYGTFKFTTTPGGRFVNEYLYARKNPGGESMRLRSQDMFRKEKSDTKSASGVEEATETAVSNGTITTKEVHVDDQGIATLTTREITELKQENSSVEKVVTPRAIVTRKTDTNMVDPETELPNGSDYGSVKYTRTPGGLYVNETLTIEKNEEGASMKMRTRDAFKTEHSDTKSAESLDDVADGGDDVEEAADGKITLHEGHVDDQGIATLTTRTVQETNVEDAEVKLVRTLHGVLKTVRHRNRRGTDHYPNTLDADDYLLKKAIGESEQRTLNPGRSTDVVTTELVPDEKGVMSDSCQLTSTEHTTRHNEVLEKDEEVEAKEKAKAGKGKYSSEEISVKEDGAKIRETVEVEEINRIYGSRVHEDALLAYTVVDKTSNKKNVGEVGQPDRDTSLDHENPDPGDADPQDPKDPGKAKTSTGASDYRGTHGNNMPTTVAVGDTFDDKELIDGAGFKRGQRVDCDSDLTKGGRFRTKEYTFIAKPQMWEDKVLTEYYVQHKWTFRNYDSDAVKALTQKMANESAKYNYGTFTVRPDVNRTMNEYGLFDGVVSYIATSPSRIGSGTTGKRAIPDGERHPHEKIDDWWEKSISIVPITPLNPDEYSGDAWFRVNVEWRHLEFGWGRGLQEYKNFLQDDNHSFWADSKHSYNIESQLFTYTKVKERKVYVYLVKGDNVGDIGDSKKPILSDADINSMSQHNRDEGELGS